jgi:SPP1 family predicted phage head-tail adaptor
VAVTTAADLIDRVGIQSKTTTADTQGGRSVSWATTATVWANVRAARASEQQQAQAVGSHVDYAVTIRYRADVTPSMRLSWTPYGSTTARTLQINGVHPTDGGRSFLVLTCQEVQ